MLLLQGYSSKDRKSTLIDDWDLSESGGKEASEVNIGLCLLPYFFVSALERKVIYRLFELSLAPASCQLSLQVAYLPFSKGSILSYS